MKLGSHLICWPLNRTVLFLLQDIYIPYSFDTIASDYWQLIEFCMTVSSFDWMTP